MSASKINAKIELAFLLNNEEYFMLKDGIIPNNKTDIVIYALKNIQKYNKFNFINFNKIIKLDPSIFGISEKINDKYYYINLDFTPINEIMNKIRIILDKGAPYPGRITKELILRTILRTSFIIHNIRKNKFSDILDSCLKIR